MSEDPTPITRRTALRLATAGVAGAAGLGTVGLAVGQPDAPVRVNVGYSSPAGATAARSAAEEVHYEFAFDALTITAPRSTARDLAGRGSIDYVELDTPMQALAQELPWGIDRTDSEVAHANGDTGEGADIAIIDTGIDATHPDLATNLGEGKSFVGSSATGTGTPAWQDDNGHGTHCAGIADAIDNSQGVVGVSTTATLHAVKVLSASGVGLTSDIAKGVEYVADQGWDVGSMSLGGDSSTDTLKNACQYAAEKGVLLVAAAGNSGPCTDCVGFPAAYSTVVAVSATSEDDSLADFSSQGPEVELAAPGDSIYSTYLGGYATLSGTSMACPHVSGAGGQLMADGATADEARRQLKSSSEDIGLSSNESGAGLLDVASALGHDSSDDLGSSSGDSTTPTVSVDDVTEQESPNPHAEFDVTWSAHDDGGNLDTVSLQLRDVTDGAFEDSASVDVGGSDASGTTRLTAHKDDGSGHDYSVTVNARDASGNASEASASLTENGQ